jgi:hypothetical protein
LDQPGHLERDQPFGAADVEHVIRGTEVRYLPDIIPAGFAVPAFSPPVVET